MNEVVERNIRTLETYLTEAAGTATFTILDGCPTACVGYYYNPKSGLVIEIIDQGECIDPGKYDHDFTLQSLDRSGRFKIADYEPPEEATTDAKINLAETVRVWNERHAGLD